MNSGTLLTTDGCDRATAYHMSNKIVRHRTGLYTTWLDRTYRIIVARLDPDSFAVLDAYPVARGQDNHCGAALAIDSQDRLHIVCGAHINSGFIHRVSVDPTDPQSWSLPLSAGVAATYPSLIATAAGGLVLAYRQRAFSGGRNNVVIQHYLPDREAWSSPVAVLASPLPGYSYFTNSLALGPDQSVHLLVEFYKTFPPQTEPAKSQAVTHLMLPPGATGVTDWQHSDGRPLLATPAQVEDCVLLHHDPAGDLRPGNLCITPTGTPCACIFNARTGSLALYRLCQQQWLATDLTAAATDLAVGQTITSQGRISLTPGGNLCIVTTVSPTGEWGANQQIVCLVCDPQTGAVQRTDIIDKADPELLNWLCSLEQVSGRLPKQPPLMIYLEGHNGAGCVNENRSNVRIVQIELP